MEGRALGLILIITGLGVAAIGALLASGLFNWFGRLPGDIRYVSDSTRIYIPVTSMILVSIVLTIAINVLRRLL